MSVRCFNRELVDSILESCAKNKELFFDIESNHQYVSQADWELWGIGISDGTTGVYVPVEAPLCSYVAEKIWGFDGRVIGHNPKYDLRGLKKAYRLRGYPKKIICTLIALNLIDENLNPSQVGLKPTILRLFDIQMMTYEEAVAFGRGSEEFAQLPEGCHVVEVGVAKA